MRGSRNNGASSNVLFRGTLSLNSVLRLGKVEQVTTDGPDIVEQTGANPDKIEQALASPDKIEQAAAKPDKVEPAMSGPENIE